MQIDRTGQHALCFLSTPHADTQSDSIPISLLPLHGYHEHIRATPLPLHLLALPLPEEIMYMIQRLCTHKDLLALTAINKVAFATRFANPRLQHLYFSKTMQVDQFLACCKAIPEGIVANALRTRQAFQPIYVLTLALSKQLSIKQSERLFAYLPSITELKIRLAAEQRVFSLERLFKAAQYLKLTRLCIASLPYHRRKLDDALPAALWQWTSLKTLKLHVANGFMYVPEEIGKLTRLTSLHLAALAGDNRHLRFLPESIGQLTQLEELVIEKFSVLSYLPDALAQLTLLKSLKLRDLSLNVLPVSLAQFAKLTFLTLEDLHAIENLPNISQLTALTSLAIGHMMSLEYLPASLCQLVKLEQLKLYHLPHIKELPAQIGQLQTLTLLSLKNLSLNALPPSLWQLTKLESLVLDCLYLTHPIFEEMGQLKALTSLVIQYLPLKVLPDNIWQLLPKLERLHLGGFRNVEHIPEGIDQLTTLKVLKLSNISSLKQLPATLCHLKKLEKLELNALNKLKTLPDEIHQLASLKSFVLKGMDALKALPEDLRHIATLQHIILGYHKDKIFIPTVLATYIKRK